MLILLPFHQLLECLLEVIYVKIFMTCPVFWRQILCYGQLFRLLNGLYVCFFSLKRTRRGTWTSWWRMQIGLLTGPVDRKTFPPSKSELSKHQPLISMATECTQLLVCTKNVVSHFGDEGVWMQKNEAICSETSAMLTSSWSFHHQQHCIWIWNAAETTTTMTWNRVVGFPSISWSVTSW